MEIIDVNTGKALVKKAIQEHKEIYSCTSGKRILIFDDAEPEDFRFQFKKIWVFSFNLKNQCTQSVSLIPFTRKSH